MRRGRPSGGGGGRGGATSRARGADAGSPRGTAGCAERASLHRMDAARAHRGSHRVGIDIGGTFTDLAAVDQASGKLHLTKADTVAAARERGALAALASSDVPPEAVGILVHGTTIVINAVTERNGARTALLTTAGFRDVLEIGRANRPDIYSLAYLKPRSFVPRQLRFEVQARMH